MSERGLYGQSESDSAATNGTEQRYADVLSEGLKTSDGMPTEQGWRILMRDEAKLEMKAADQESRAIRKANPDLKKAIAALKAQKEALNRQGELAHDMREAG